VHQHEPTPANRYYNGSRSKSLLLVDADIHPAVLRARLSVDVGGRRAEPHTRAQPPSFAGVDDTPGVIFA
jgi:hypothetical protein